MEQILKREEQYKRIYPIALTAYWLISAGLAIYWITVGDLYQAAHSVGSMLLPILYRLVYRLLKVNKTYQLDIAILLFTFFSYSMGVAARWYHLIPFYDKIMHTLSGTFTMLLALPVFYFIKADRKVSPDDCLLVIVFGLASALAVAGIWEICEYFIHMVTGIDVQNAVGSGVNDTMQDMIVCLIGSLLTLPSMLRYYTKGKTGLFMGSVLAFVANNGGAVPPQA